MTGKRCHRSRDTSQSAREFTNHFTWYTMHMPVCSFHALTDLGRQMLIDHRSRQEEQPAGTQVEEEDNDQMHNDLPAFGTMGTCRLCSQLLSSARGYHCAILLRTIWRSLVPMERARLASKERHAARMVSRAMMQCAAEVFLASEP